MPAEEKEITGSLTGSLSTKETSSPKDEREDLITLIKQVCGSRDGLAVSLGVKPYLVSDVINGRRSIPLPTEPACFEDWCVSLKIGGDRLRRSVLKEQLTWCFNYPLEVVAKAKKSTSLSNALTCSCGFALILDRGIWMRVESKGEHQRLLSFYCNGCTPKGVPLVSLGQKDWNSIQGMIF